MLRSSLLRIRIMSWSEKCWISTNLRLVTKKFRSTKWSSEWETLIKFLGWVVFILWRKNWNFLQKIAFFSKLQPRWGPAYWYPINLKLCQFHFLANWQLLRDQDRKISKFRFLVTILLTMFRWTDQWTSRLRRDLRWQSYPRS